MISPESVLTALLLAISSWTLLSVVRLREQMVRLEQRLADLPCSQCPQSVPIHRAIRPRAGGETDAVFHQTNPKTE